MIKVFFTLFFSFSVAISPTWGLVEPLSWQFPKDHASHKSFDNEWWYFTGHLKGQNQRLYGFQVTFFRHKLTMINDNNTPWNAPQLYTAHFAFTDSANNVFLKDDIYTRDHFKQVQDSEDRLNLSVKEWHLVYENNQFNISITTEDYQFKLTLKPSKPVIFHGKNGINYKNDDKTTYSHYYSHTRLLGSGSFKTKSKHYIFVQASAWLDREIFDALLDSKQDGWDWFAIQLDNNEELMIYRLRSKGKNYCFGNYVDKYGNSRLIPKDQITISELKHWKSEESGNSYPVKWEIKLPNQKKRFIINSVLDNQEQSASVPFSFSYWEGQAVVSGSHSGLAYVEVVRNLSSDAD